MVPVMVTEVPPACGPEVGLMAVTVGCRCVVGELVAAVAVEVPFGVVTVTLTVPVPAGDDGGDRGGR